MPLREALFRAVRALAQEWGSGMVSGSEGSTTGNLDGLVGQIHLSVPDNRTGDGRRVAGHRENQFRTAGAIFLEIAPGEPTYALRAVIGHGQSDQASRFGPFRPQNLEIARIQISSAIGGPLLADLLNGCWSCSDCRAITTHNRRLAPPLRTAAINWVTAGPSSGVCSGI